MPEHDCLPLDQTAADVVATFGELSGLPARAARQRASDVLDLVGLDEARFRPVGGFSTGMRQRTKLAQAIVADPELVLLDEPTAGLDPMGREEMLGLVARLGGLGISVLLATHLLDDVQQVCDHVVMLDGGHLVVSGATGSLLERTGLLTVDVGSRPRRARRPPRRAGARGHHRGGAGRGAGAAATTTSTPCATRSPTSACPLHRMTTRLTSLDEVFLDRAGRRLMTGAVYDRGYRAYEGERGGRAAARAALFRASVRRALGLRRPWRQKVAPFVLLAHRRRCRPIVYVGVAYVTRDTPASDFEFITYRDVRRRLEHAARVRRPHRARHRVPRPAPARAPAALRPSAQRASTTCSPRSGRCSRSSSRSRSCPRSCSSSARCS